MKKKPESTIRPWHAVLAVLALGFLLAVGSRQYNADRAVQIDAKEKIFDSIRLRPISDRDHYRGSLDAPVQVIIFSDPECPYCKYLHMQLLPELRKAYGQQIVIAYRHHLRPQFSRSPIEAQATECAAIVGGEEKFWRYLDRIYQITPSDNNLDPKEINIIAEYVGVPLNQFAECLDTEKGKARVDEDRQEANLNDIITAPTVVVLPKNGKPLYLPGAYMGPIKAAIEASLNRPQS